MTQTTPRGDFINQPETYEVNGELVDRAAEYQLEEIREKLAAIEAAQQPPGYLGWEGQYLVEELVKYMYVNGLRAVELDGRIVTADASVRTVVDATLTVVPAADPLDFSAHRNYSCDDTGDRDLLDAALIGWPIRDLEEEE